jgi:hypothetical protein
MLLVNDVTLKFQIPGGRPFVVRLNVYVLLPFSRQIGEPCMVAHGFV